MCLSKQPSEKYMLELYLTTRICHSVFFVPWQLTGPLPMAVSPLITQNKNTLAKLVLLSCAFDFKVWLIVLIKCEVFISDQSLWHEYFINYIREHKKRIYLSLTISDICPKTYVQRYFSQSCLTILKIWKDLSCKIVKLFIVYP